MSHAVVSHSACPGPVEQCKAAHSAYLRSCEYVSAPVGHGSRQSRQSHSFRSHCTCASNNVAAACCCCLVRGPLSKICARQKSLDPSRPPRAEAPRHSAIPRSNASPRLRPAACLLPSCFLLPACPPAHIHACTPSVRRRTSARQSIHQRPSMQSACVASIAIPATFTRAPRRTVPCRACPPVPRKSLALVICMHGECAMR